VAWIAVRSAPVSIQLRRTSGTPALAYVIRPAYRSREIGLKDERRIAPIITQPGPLGGAPEPVSDGNRRPRPAGMR
jgi:hypothetical protein